MHHEYDENSLFSLIYNESIIDCKCFGHFVLWMFYKCFWTSSIIWLRHTTIPRELWWFQKSPNCAEMQLLQSWLKCCHSLKINRSWVDERLGNERINVPFLLREIHDVGKCQLSWELLWVNAKTLYMNNPKWHSETKKRKPDWIKLPKINLKKKKQENDFYWASVMIFN